MNKMGSLSLRNLETLVRFRWERIIWLWIGKLSQDILSNIITNYQEMWPSRNCDTTSIQGFMEITEDRAKCHNIQMGLIMCLLVGKISLGTLTHINSYTWGSEKGRWGPDMLVPLCHHTLFRTILKLKMGVSTCIYGESREQKL